MNLPLYAAAANGVFARHGLDVELAVAPRRALADGDVDACVTTVRSLLSADDGGFPAPARFIAVVHQRSPIAAMVAAGSELHRPADLGGRRLAVSRFGWFLAEFEAALTHAGVGLPALVAVPATDAQAPLRRGEVDMIASWSELVAWTRRRAGIAVRPVAVGPPVYTTGLAVTDTMPGEVAGRLRAAFAEALAQPRDAVAVGLAECGERAPQVPATDVLEEWDLLHPNVLSSAGPGTMTAARWSDTLDWAASFHGLARLAIEDLCRTELLVEDYAAAAT